MHLNIIHTNIFILYAYTYNIFPPIFFLDLASVARCNWIYLFFGLIHLKPMETPMSNS